MSGLCQEETPLEACLRRIEEKLDRLLAHAYLEPSETEKKFFELFSGITSKRRSTDAVGTTGGKATVERMVPPEAIEGEAL